MAVPPHSGRDVDAAFESELRDEAAPSVPKPLPDRDRSRTAAVVTVVLALILIAVIVLF